MDLASPPVRGSLLDPTFLKSGMTVSLSLVWANPRPAWVAGNRCMATTNAKATLSRRPAAVAGSGSRAVSWSSPVPAPVDSYDLTGVPARPLGPRLLLPILDSPSEPAYDRGREPDPGRATPNQGNGIQRRRIRSLQGEQGEHRGFQSWMSRRQLS